MHLEQRGSRGRRFPPTPSVVAVGGVSALVRMCNEQSLETQQKNHSPLTLHPLGMSIRHQKFHAHTAGPKATILSTRMLHVRVIDHPLESQTFSTLSRPWFLPPQVSPTYSPGYIGLRPPLKTSFPLTSAQLYRPISSRSTLCTYVADPEARYKCGGNRSQEVAKPDQQLGS